MHGGVAEGIVDGQPEMASTAAVLGSPFAVF